MKARAYMEAPPMSVVLCANRLADRTEMEEALVHELVHVYDVRLFGFMGSCVQGCFVRPPIHPPTYHVDSTRW